MMTRGYMCGLDALGEEVAVKPAPEPIVVVVARTPWQTVLKTVEMVAIVLGLYHLATKRL